MPKRILFISGAFLISSLLLNACATATPARTLPPTAVSSQKSTQSKLNANATSPTTTRAVPPTAVSNQNSTQPTANDNAQPTLPSVANGENGGEGGTEAALVTYADAAQHFSIGHPGPWTQDPSVKQGVKFAGGDDTMTLDFLNLPQGQDAMTFAKNDTSLNNLAGYKQIGLAPSAEVQNAIVLGFQSDGKSAVTGKAFQARGDRYYMPLADGHIAVLTVVGPQNHYDRESVRDIALTFKVN